MKCTHCGKEIDDDSVFCEHCGKKVIQPPKTEPPKTPKSQPPKITKPKPKEAVPGQNVALALGLIALFTGIYTGIIIGGIGLMISKNGYETYNENPDKYIGTDTLKIGKTTSIIGIIEGVIGIIIFFAITM